MSGGGVYIMEEHMCGVWRSEENVMETVLSFFIQRGPGIKLRSLGRCGKQAHPLRPSPTAALTH